MQFNPFFAAAGLAVTSAGHPGCSSGGSEPSLTSVSKDVPSCGICSLSSRRFKVQRFLATLFQLEPTQVPLSGGSSGVSQRPGKGRGAVSRNGPSLHQRPGLQPRSSSAGGSDPELPSCQPEHLSFLLALAQDRLRGPNRPSSSDTALTGKPLSLPKQCFWLDVGTHCQVVLPLDVVHILIKVIFPRAFHQIALC